MVTDAMREGSVADAVDGVVPRQIVEPADAAELAAALKAASLMLLNAARSVCTLSGLRRIRTITFVTTASGR